MSSAESYERNARRTEKGEKETERKKEKEKRAIYTGVL
jgi:hypothetical protein